MDTTRHSWKCSRLVSRTPTYTFIGLHFKPGVETLDDEILSVSCLPLASRVQEWWQPMSKKHADAGTDVVGTSESKQGWKNVFICL